MGELVPPSPHTRFRPRGRRGAGDAPTSTKPNPKLNSGTPRPKRRKRNLGLINERRCTVLVLVLIFLTIAIGLLVLPIETSDFSANSGNFLSSQYVKNSGQFSISQLCATKSMFPVVKKVEGAVLLSSGDIDTNCTITFRTKLSQQHFIIKFEELRLGCDDHLKMFDGDIDYGQQSIKDFSCRDSMASAPVMQTTGTFLTLRYSSDMKAKASDGFRLVLTAVFDMSMSDCPNDYAYCRNRLCISKSLFCDGVNHCIDNSDEMNCAPGSGGSIGILPTGGSMFGSGDLSLSNALMILVGLVLIIFICVISFIWAIYCCRETPYAQYQHHLQRAIGVPLQTSSSLMFANHQPQYHYFQPANMSPYITPQHHAIATTSLPRGYSTLPLNLVRQPQVQGSPIAAKGANMINNEYLMMTGLSGPPAAGMQGATTAQTSLYLPMSQSIITTPIRQQQPAPQHKQQQNQQTQPTSTQTQQREQR